MVAMSRRSAKDVMDYAMEGGEEQYDSKSGHSKYDIRGFLCSPRGLCSAVAALLACFLLPKLGRSFVSLFVAVEQSIDGSSWIHMFGFILVSLFFHIPFPLPVVMQAWSIAIGCIFGWWGFVMLAVSFSCGVPMSFSIGRHVAQTYGRVVEDELEHFLPTGVTYMRSLRKAAKRQPVRLSFLLMWAPLPTSLCPFMVGFLLPETDVSLEEFLMGAIPSKVLHFACQVMIGIQAGSFSKAMAAHDGGHSDGQPKDSSDWSGVVAFGSTILSLILIVYMMLTIHHELDDYKKQQDHEESMPWYGKADSSPKTTQLPSFSLGNSPKSKGL